MKKKSKGIKKWFVFLRSQPYNFFFEILSHGASRKGRDIGILLFLSTHTEYTTFILTHDSQA